MDEERTYVAVDVNSLWHSCREIFGLDARISYPSLKDLIDRHSHSDTAHGTTLVAYAVSPPRTRIDQDGNRVETVPQNSKFISYLEQVGYEVKTRHIHEVRDHIKSFRAEWDVGITIDAIEMEEEYDTFVLVSGGGNYIMLLEELTARGKRVEVVTFEQTASKILYAATDSIIFLSRKEIFHQVRNRSMSNDTY